MRQSQLPFARYNRSIASAPLGEKLRFTETTQPHHADADEVSEDGELSYEELRGDLMTIGWNNHEMTALEVVDMNGDPVNADDEGSGGDDDRYDPDDEVRGIRARFCAMSRHEQNRFIAKMKLRICSMIGASYFDWEPSDEFILEIIEDETPDAAIEEMARAAYLATPLPPEDNPSDEDVGPGLDEEDDLIRIGQGSRERGLPNIGWRNLDSRLERRDHRRGPRQQVTGGSPDSRQVSDRRYRSANHSWLNSESHCPKYGRQDWRHQAPRIEAKAERRFAAYEARVEAYYQAVYYDWWDNEEQIETNFTEAEMEELNARFDFSEDHFFYEDREICRKMEEMARAFGHTIDDPCDIAGTRGYMPEDFRRRGYYGPDRFDDFGYDPYDFYDDFGYDDDLYDDPEPCRCAQCTEESEHQRLVDRFGDWYGDMGIFEGYGESEADIDTKQFGQSNSKRRTYHLRELMERRPELV